MDHRIVLARLTRIPAADPPSHDIASPLNVYVCVPQFVPVQSSTQFILSDDVADKAIVQSIFVSSDDRFHSPTYGLGSTRNHKCFKYPQAHVYFIIHFLFFYNELTSKLKYIPEAGQAPVLQACSSTFSVPTQAVPPFSSCRRIVLNLYCFPPPHVVVHPV